MNRRYHAALLQLQTKGAEAEGRAYEAAVENSSAIFCVPLAYALSLLDGRRLHQNYHQGVDSGSRMPADYHDDAMRKAVDAQIFGSAGRKITMAALSLEALGLPSYGTVAMQFHESFCKARASLLSENSFEFVKRYAGRPEALPLGHRATWDDRARLALVKAADHLTAGMDPTAFPNVLLTPGSTRRDDRFMEVHVFESWNIDAVVSMKVRASSLTSPLERAQAAELGENLPGLGISWQVVP